MFGSSRNTKSPSRKRFWPFGRKKQKDNLPAETVSEEEVITETSTDAVPEAVNNNLQQTSETSETSSIDASDEMLSVPQAEINNGALLKNEQLTEENFDDTTKLSINKTIETKEEDTKKATGLFAKIRFGLRKTRNSFIKGIENLFLGKKKIDGDLLEELEMQLITADLGIEATTSIIEHLTQQLRRKELHDADAVIASLKKELLEIIKPCAVPLIIDRSKKPYVILVVGVNGVGKTTTIGKLARQFQQQNHKVMLAAGDTFRAAAIEQLQAWGERNKVPVIAQHHGADSASVIFDAYQSAKARNYDVLIVDTAGRLHNKSHLMAELKKINRVLARLDDTSPHEVMLIIDAGTGQNAISQATLFNDAVRLTGITFTKLDGTAKGGIVFALAKKLKLPVRYLGVGEQVNDLQPFSATAFIDALFADFMCREQLQEEEHKSES